MSLTKQDLKDIRGVVLDALDVAVNPRLDVIESDIDELKTDVAELKTDVTELKTDVAELKTDVSTLKSDMRQVKGSLISLEDKVITLEADIKEIYLMLADFQKAQLPDKQFKKLNLEQKLLKINAELLATAKEAGISLPR